MCMASRFNGRRQTEAFEAALLEAQQTPYNPRAEVVAIEPAQTAWGGEKGSVHQVYVGLKARASGFDGRAADRSVGGCVALEGLGGRHASVKSSSLFSRRKSKGKCAVSVCMLPGS